jgi:manganese transport system substrate-binding protein
MRLERQLKAGSRIKQWQWSVIASVAIGLLLMGCTPKPDSAATSSGNTPSANQKRVLTTFTILADMARNVAGDNVIVESITKVGTEIHGYEPTPSDLVKAQNADLLLNNGLNLERWFEKFYGKLKRVPTVTLSTGIQPIAIAEGAYQAQPNPHAWMSPRNALIYVENIRDALVNLDPANALSYETNAQTYRKALQQIDQTLKTQLAALPSSQRFLVSCEGAFSYLARDYGFREIYLWPINAEQQSTPQQIQRVIDQVRLQNIPAVFCESTVNNKGQLQVAKETGATYGGTLYVDSLSPPDGPVPTYFKLLEHNANVIIRGLTTSQN